MLKILILNRAPLIFILNKATAPIPRKLTSGGRRRAITMVGRSQIDRCRSCGVQLLVPPLSRTIRCAVCHVTTNLHSPQDSSSTAGAGAGVRGHHDRIRQARGWLNSMFIASRAGTGSFGTSSSGDRSVMDFPAIFPATRSKKRAVLVGVSYTFRPYELKGTVNDVNCMKYLLYEKFQFPAEGILVLSEEESDPRRIPTKENIRAAMRWLVRGCDRGDSLVFHFSGHGSQKLDLSGDEADGYTETLCPVDYEENGVILDDEINASLVRPLPPGAKLHAIVDSCHSGTVLDLPFLCRMSRGGSFQWQDQSSKSGEFKGTSGGFAVCISGCDDSQIAQDTQVLSGSVTTGAMTYGLIYAVERESGPTYGSLLGNMRSLIRGADARVGTSGPVTSFVKTVLSFGSTQEPQLSASEKFDVYRKPFLL